MCYVHLMPFCRPSIRHLVYDHLCASSHALIFRARESIESEDYPQSKQNETVINNERPPSIHCIQRFLTWEGATDHRKQFTRSLKVFYKALLDGDSMANV